MAPMIRAPQILILSRDPVRVRCWTLILAGGMRVWQAAAEVPAEVLPEVIVTDLAALDETDLLPHETLRRAWQAGEVGWVAIGDAPAADICLAADFSPRELQQVCSLLADAVHWRREYHRARQLQQTFSELALTDPLTGLPNRRAWEQELRRRSARPDSTPGCVCLALFDVDCFKAINDRFGHIAGDEVLCHLGRSLAREQQAGDYVARLGGDEFAILLTGRDQESAANDVEALRAGASQGAPHAKVTVSAGFAFAKTLPGNSFQSLFESADIALRVAKRNGRDRTVAA